MLQQDIGRERKMIVVDERRRNEKTGTGPRLEKWEWEWEWAPVRSKMFANFRPRGEWWHHRAEIYAQLKALDAWLVLRDQSGCEDL